MAWFQLIRKQGSRSAVEETPKVYFFSPGFTIDVYLKIEIVLFFLIRNMWSIKSQKKRLFFKK